MLGLYLLCLVDSLESVSKQRQISVVVTALDGSILLPLWNY